jgi:GTPase SAR1 family protein
MDVFVSIALPKHVCQFTSIDIRGFERLESLHFAYRVMANWRLGKYDKLIRKQFKTWYLL